MEERTEIIYDSLSFPYCILNKYDTLTYGKGCRAARNRDIIDCVCAFDIETTRINETDSVMYIWQFQLEEYTIIGRTWDEFKAFLMGLLEYTNDRRLIIFVHNLSFEFQFLSGILNFNTDDVFCIKSRKILKATYLDFEFRCSYLLTNKSLDKFLKDENVENKKITGFDYTIKRYWFTPITEEDMEYCINDVKGLVQAIRSRMNNNGDDLKTIPLTSTGYIRRMARRSMGSFNRQVKKILPAPEVYTLLREAFRGGNTHASRFFADKVLNDVKSYDKSSSYPDSLVNKKYPMSRFLRVDNCKTEDDLDRIISKRKKAVVFRCALENVDLDIFNPCPYLSFSKCRKVKGKILDNGRIIHADYLETTITDIDYKIISSQYTYKITIMDCYISNYGYLPDGLRELIIKLYKEKTRLKGDKEKAYDYARFKELINAVYGMMAQDPAKETISFINNSDDLYIIKNAELSERLEESYKSAFLPYQWGVWCTAHSRMELQTVIDRVEETPGANFVYADTDSVKYIESGTEVTFKDINVSRETLSIKNGAFENDIKGNRHVLGLFEYEGQYKRFKTLGAKKYCIENYDGSIEITVAGVPKAKGGIELAEQGGIDAFKVGFLFKADKLETVYNDHTDYHIEVDGHDVHVTRCVTLRPTTYLLGIDNDYAEILKDASLFRKALGS